MPEVEPEPDIFPTASSSSNFFCNFFVNLSRFSHFDVRTVIKAISKAY